METTLQQLVKLASLGTAGVCVLAIFIIGTSIFRLSNDTPQWKVTLMKKYMNTCIFIALICAISGGTNAYFNQNKINTAQGEQEIAENNLKELGDRYEIESEQWIESKSKLEENLRSLKTSLTQNSTTPTYYLQKIDNMESTVREQHVKTKAEIMKGLNVRIEE